MPRNLEFPIRNRTPPPAVIRSLFHEPTPRCFEPSDQFRRPHKASGIIGFAKVVIWILPCKKKVVLFIFLQVWGSTCKYNNILFISTN